MKKGPKKEAGSHQKASKRESGGLPKIIEKNVRAKVRKRWPGTGQK